MWSHGQRHRRCAMPQVQSDAAWWYPPPAAPPYLFSSVSTSAALQHQDVGPPSNTREMRNRAEKMRRDKLNDCIRELGKIVPMVSRSTKRVDKTSILRLTASHLRLHQILLTDVVPKKEYSMVDPIALDQLMYEQLEGFLLIVTPTGKIVFVSHTVEQLLGHLQTDLIGHSIYTIASSEDYDRLRVHLSLDTLDSEWRRYFSVSLAKAGPRTETPTYELFNVMGMLRPPPAPQSSTAKAASAVLVFFVKLYRPPPLSELLVEANKEEYMTRHLIDGRIINCDHRISFVAGYMIEEISGLSAFKFMHREDVRWTMIALRQMYDRGESVGWSCYRLLSRTGQFIYLRTLGYLEVDNAGVVESFVCVNTLVAEDEGKKLIKEMKERYSVMINANAQLSDSDVSNASVEDPTTLDECIKYLITNHVPTSPKTDVSSPGHSDIQDCFLTELSVESNKSKRAPESDESTGRKRQKRRTVSTSSSTGSADIVLEPYAPRHRVVAVSSSLALGSR